VVKVARQPLPTNPPSLNPTGDPRTETGLRRIWERFGSSVLARVRGENNVRYRLALTLTLTLNPYPPCSPRPRSCLCCVRARPARSIERGSEEGQQTSPCASPAGRFSALVVLLVQPYLA
jgi:hypothetical protein